MSHKERPKHPLFAKTFTDMHTLSLTRLFTAVITLLTGASLSCSGMSGVDSFEVIAEYELPAFREPSGIVFHPDRQTLFIVGDEGDVGEVSLAGVLLRQQRISNANFEGITVDPATGLLYIAIEGEDEILKIDSETFEVADRYSLEQHFSGRKVLTKNNNGLEGITLVQDPGSGNSSLWITNQVFDHDNPEDISGVFQYILSDTAVAPLLTLNAVLESKTVDLAGIFYDPANNRLYVVSDRENLLLEMDRSGNVHATYVLPGKTQEGITRDHEGFFYIAQDAGGILKLRFIKP